MLGGPPTDRPDKPPSKSSAAFEWGAWAGAARVDSVSMVSPSNNESPAAASGTLELEGAPGPTSRPANMSPEVFEGVEIWGMGSAKSSSRSGTAVGSGAGGAVDGGAGSGWAADSTPKS